ncbi:PREDICTED: fructose-1,6-bisphosphatase, cytosolic-like [Prunus mume]|uniref:fructose-bisphosphatase n=1 Tax=Prunus mume TaxID=102107 RepID=A0ABM1LHP5_PRUMU|nr:PREDICTED: fructose-1,6-bisphosphatase, cytosolic-like [Prunus mume]
MLEEEEAMMKPTPQCRLKQHHLQKLQCGDISIPFFGLWRRGRSRVEGLIFGIYLVKDKQNPTLDDVLGPGSNMVAAGNCMYGSSCTLVISTGHGVNGFTLDPSLGEFILTHSNIKIPQKGKIYSVNEGNAQTWDDQTAKYVEKCKFPKDGSSPKSLRYFGRYNSVMNVLFAHHFLSVPAFCSGTAMHLLSTFTLLIGAINLPAIALIIT